MSFSAYAPVLNNAMEQFRASSANLASGVASFDDVCECNRVFHRQKDRADEDFECGDTSGITLQWHHSLCHDDVDLNVG